MNIWVVSNYHLGNFLLSMGLGFRYSCFNVGTLQRAELNLYGIMVPMLQLVCVGLQSIGSFVTIVLS